MECLVQAVAINVVGNVYKTIHAIQLLVIAIVDVIQDILMIFATKVCTFANNKTLNIKNAFFETKLLQVF